MRPLREVELVAVCSPDLPDVGPRPSLEHILRLPLIEDTHRRWDKLIEQQGLSKPLKAMNFNSASLSIDAAVNVQGVAIVPSLFVERDIAEGRLKEIWKNPEPSGEFIFLVWPNQKVPFKPLMDVVHWIHVEFDRDVVGSGDDFETSATSR